MTDNEIIRSLECCANWENDKSCEECPANTYGFGCGNKMANHILDLINRQKAEIVRLEKELELANADKVIAETHEKSAKEMFVDVTQQIKTAKSEAIKEFVYTLKNRVVKKYDYTDIRIFDEIDNLVKEMTEENENESN